MKLQFEAALGDVKIRSGKPADSTYGQPKGGEIALTLVVQQPVRRREPVLPYWKARPEDAVMEKGESSATFEKRRKQVEAEQQRYDEAMAAFEADHAKWEREGEVFGQMTAAYALLAGAGAVLGAGKLLVSIEPGRDQPVLPGFDVQLLPLLEAGA